MGRSAATRAGQPGRRAQTRLRHHAGRGADHGRTAKRGDPLRGDRASRGSRPDRAARIRRPSSALSDHGGRRRGSGPAIRADEQGRLAGQGAAEHQPGQGRSLRPPAQVPSATLLCRTALAVYPPSWRARYADEVRALLDDSAASPAAIASLAWRALPAWLWPSRALHDGPARMRASLATVLMAGSMLIGLGLVFAQLTQLQGFRPAQHPVIGWCYAGFDASFALSLLVAAAGGLPLWLLMLRRARREVRLRAMAYLLLPVIASAIYLAALIGTLKLVGGPGGAGPWWFLALTLAGFVAAAIAAAWPGGRPGRRWPGVVPRSSRGRVRRGGQRGGRAGRGHAQARAPWPGAPASHD